MGDILGAVNNSMSAVASNHQNLSSVASAITAAGWCSCSESTLRTCGIRCFGQSAGWTRAKCVMNCLKPTLGASCAECYGQRSDCTMVKCLGKCMRSATSDACTGCVHSKCGGECR